MDDEKRDGMMPENTPGGEPQDASGGGGFRSLLSRAPVTMALIALNVAAFILSMLVPSVRTYGMLWPSAVISAGAWWMLLTSMFLHGGVLHLACNMLSLLWLGPESEVRNGHARFLLLYMLGGIGGGLAHIMWEMWTGAGTPALGASGAIFAVLGNYGYVLLTVRRQVGAGKSAMLDRAWSSFASCLAINLFIGLTDSGIAMAAHVGGLVTGVLVAVATRGLPGKPRGGGSGGSPESDQGGMG